MSWKLFARKDNMPRVPACAGNVFASSMIFSAEFCYRSISEMENHDADTMADDQRQKQLSPLTGAEGMGGYPETFAESETE